MGALRLACVLVGSFALVAAAPVSPATLPKIPPVVASGLRIPADIAVAPGEPRRLYVAEQRGTIRAVVGGRARLFLDIRRRVRMSLLQGLFSVVFHPRYATDRRFYVDYVGNDGRVKIVEFRSRAGRAISASARELLDLAVGQDHYGGELVFGPDGLLYIGVGDGQSGADAQNPASVRGKILRLDVDDPAAVPEVVALGLRNPWRFSFDRRTGDLYIADVGAELWEELDYFPRGTETVPNYGWNLYEGPHRRNVPLLEPLPQLTFPILAYRNPRKGCAAIVGGHVYRGAGAPRLRGRYFYGDLCSTAVWSIRVVAGKALDRRRAPFIVPGGITSFGEGLRGELYATSLNGTVYRLLG